MSTLVEMVKNNHVPDHWAPMKPGEEILLVDIPEGTEEYENVCRKIRNQKPPKESDKVPRVSKLQRIQNPYLWGCYQLKKLEYKHLRLQENEVTLYHETSPENVDSIVADNLDWRRYQTHMFGKGANFSAKAWYARSRANYKGVMFVTRLLRGQSIQRKDCEVPPEHFDTTTSGLYNSYVIVGFNDNDFYPEYVVYWETEAKQDEEESKSSTSMAYPG